MKTHLTIQQNRRKVRLTVSYSVQDMAAIRVLRRVRGTMPLKKPWSPLVQKERGKIEKKISLTKFNQNTDEQTIKYLIQMQDGRCNSLVFLGVSLHVCFDHISWLGHDSSDTSRSKAADKVQLGVKSLVKPPWKKKRNKAKLSP